MTNARACDKLIAMKAVFFDIDGTLDDENGVVPESAKYAVARAGEMGALLFVNTGRPYSHIIPAVKEMGFDGFSCACGQHLILEGATKKRRALSAEDTAMLFGLARECGLDGYFESEEGVVISFIRPFFEIIKTQIVNFEKQGLPVYFDLPDGFSIDKLCVWEGEGSDLSRFVQAASHLLTPISRGRGLYEMVVNGCDKAKGMRELLDLAGHPDAETYAIGDSMNDLAMLTAVDHPIVMGGAPKELETIAEFVTDTVENDGILKALVHFGLI